MDKIETISEEEPPPRQNSITFNSKVRYACRALDNVFSNKEERRYLARAIKAARKDPTNYLSSLDARKIPSENLGWYNQFMNCYLKMTCHKLEELSRLNGFHENNQTIPEFVKENVQPFLNALYFEREKARREQNI